MEMPVSPSRHAPGLCGGGCALCADVGGFASISRVPAGSLDLPRRHLVRSGGGGTPPPASPPANMSSALPATPSSLGSPLRVSAPSRFIEAPNDCFSDDDEDQEAAFVRELLASAALDPLSAELERMELARAREAASGMRVVVASALSQERQRGESAREQHATVAALAQVPALQRAREEDRAREMRQRARRKAVLDAQSALEDEYMASLQVLESLSAQSTAARKAALLEKQRQQERQLLELQQKQERLQRETERLLEQQRAAAEQERSAAAPAPSSAPAPAAVPAGSSSTTAAPKHDLWAEYRALAESFPSEHAGKLFRIKVCPCGGADRPPPSHQRQIPITKALNQVTPEPPVTIAKAKEVVAALQQARSLSDGILRVIQYHFASQLCGMVLPKVSLLACFAGVFSHAFDRLRQNHQTCFPTPPSRPTWCTLSRTCGHWYWLLCAIVASTWCRVSSIGAKTSQNSRTSCVWAVTATPPLSASRMVTPRSSRPFVVRKCRPMPICACPFRVWANCGLC